MNTQKSFPWPALVAGSIVLGSLWVVARGPNGPTPPNTPDSPPPGAPDLLAVFAANPNRAEAKQHAQQLGAIAGCVADVLAFDGQQAEKARITTGQQLAVFRNDARHLTTGGFSFASRYPPLKDVIEKFLDERAGKDGGPLTSSAREKWIEAFRVLKQSANYASAKL